MTTVTLLHTSVPNSESLLFPKPEFGHCSLSILPRELPSSLTVTEPQPNAFVAIRYASMHGLPLVSFRTSHDRFRSRRFSLEKMFLPKGLCNFALASPFPFKRTGPCPCSQLHGATKPRRNIAFSKDGVYVLGSSVVPGQEHLSGSQLGTGNRASNASPQGTRCRLGNGGRTPSEPATASGPSRFSRKSTTAPKRFAMAVQAASFRC